jgi:uncharacterized repeat protein (TIGR01451 family)
MAINRISRLITRIRTRSERGAAAVEFAIGGGLLAVMAFGSAEYGLTLQKTHTLASAVRQASRVASTPCQPSTDCKLGNRPYDDYYILRASEAAMGEYWNQVNRVVIYKIVGNSQVKGDGGPPTQCMGDVGKSLPSANPLPVYCNVYSKNTTFNLIASPTTPLPLLSNLSKFELPTGADDTNQLKATFGSGDNCGTGLSKFFCPTAPPGDTTLRPRSLRNPSRVGVYIEANHKFVTGMFGAGRSLTQWDVFSLEPHPDDNSTDLAVTGGSTSTTSQYNLSMTLEPMTVRDYQPGDTVSYVVTITNAGTQKVNNASVLSYLPGTDLGNVTWTCTPGSGAVCPSPLSGSGADLGKITLNAGASLSYNVQAVISATFSGTSVTNTFDAILPPGFVDGDPGNNTKSHTDNVSRPDLAITTNDDGVSSVAPGGHVTYTVKAQNGGPGIAPGAVITNAFDTKLTNVTWTCAGAGCPTGTQTGNINRAFDMADGALITFTINADVLPTASGTIVNVANIAPAAGRLEASPNLLPNTMTDTDTILPPQLTVTKTLVGTAVTGAPITWKVTVTNGSTPLTGVIYNDVIPTPATGGSYVCVPTGIGTTCPTGSTIPVSGDLGTGNLAANGSVQFTITATIPAGSAATSITNTAIAKTPAPWNDPFSKALTSSITKPNLTVTKIATPSSGTSVGPGQAIKYTITAASNLIVNGVTLADMIPSAQLDTISWRCLTFTGAGNSCGAYATASSSPTLNATLNYVATGTATFEVTATVKSTVTTGTLGNTATLSLPGAPLPPTSAWESNLGDNVASVSNPISLSTLVVTKSVSDSTVSPGQTNVVYTVKVKNNGPLTVNNVGVIDTKPSQIASWSWSCAATAGSSCAALSGTGDISTTVNLASGGDATFTVTSIISPTAVTGTSFTNTATASASGLAATGNTLSASIPVNVLAPVLTTTKTVASTSGIGPGSTVTYTITVTNTGPGVANGAVITDTLDATRFAPGATWTCATTVTGSSCVSPVAGGTADAANKITQTVNLAETGKATLVVTAIVKAGATGTIANSASTNLNGVITTGTAPNVPIVVPTLTMSKAVSPTGNVGRGSVLTYTITAKNTTGGLLTVNVVDTLPSVGGVPIFAATPVPSWTCSGVCASPSGSGTSINQTVTLALNQTSTYLYTGTISPTAPLGAFSNTANGTPSGGVTVPASAANTIVGPDLSIVKDDGKTVIAPGQATAYTMNIVNNGPVDVVGAAFSDTVPAAITGVTWGCSVPAGSTCPTLVAGNVNTGKTFNLQSGKTMTITANGTVATSATGVITNTATVANPSGLTDPVAGNNSDFDDTTVTQPDLQIIKTSSSTTFNPGAVATWTITAKNNGPGNVVGATVVDSPDARLTAVNWTCVPGSGATCSASGTGPLNQVINLNDGAIATFTFKGTIPLSATGTLANTATIATPAGVTDPTPANNTSTYGPKTILGPDLKITKNDGVTAVDAGGTLTYSIVVTNLGPAPATSANVADTMPSQITGASWTCTVAGGAACGSQSGSTTFSAITGAIPVNGTVTYTATANVAATATGTISNTATVTAATGVTDPVSTNNSAVDNNTVVTTPDLAIVSIGSAAASYTAGTGITYVIVAKNNGPVALTGVKVNVTLPGMLTGLNWSCAPSCGSGSTTNAFTQTVNMASGETRTYTITGAIPSTTPAQNVTATATIVIPASYVDRDLTNQTKTETDAIIASAATGGAGDGL